MSISFSKVFLFTVDYDCTSLVLINSDINNYRRRLRTVNIGEYLPSHR